MLKKDEPSKVKKAAIIIEVSQEEVKVVKKVKVVKVKEEIKIVNAPKEETKTMIKKQPEASSKKAKAVVEKKNGVVEGSVSSPAASDIKEVISAISNRLQFVSVNFAANLTGDETLKAQFDKLHSKF